ncbi:MAG: hypothetical protein QXY08_05255 [Nitrososphaerales archaeon]
MPTQLREAAKGGGVKAKKIYPIHIEHQLFSKYVADVCEQTIPPGKASNTRLKIKQLS